jgi:hypothetical protein
VDPDPNKIYSRRKEQHSKKTNDGTHSSDAAPRDKHVKYPEENWGISLEKMPMFTRVEMDNHIKNTGKNIANKQNTSIPTRLRRAQTFLEDEYLHQIQTAHDQRCCYFKAKCCHSYKKNDPPHDLKLMICIITGEVLHGTCSCVAGTVGHCNHILALMFKLCKYTLSKCKSTKDLCEEEDETAGLACTSELQKWHRKGGGSHITPEPISNIKVSKPKVADSADKKRNRTGVKSLLYEARINVSYNQDSIDKLKSELKELIPNMGLLSNGY